MSRSDAHAVCSSSIAPPTITERVAPIRPVSRLASRRSAQRACAMAIVACMCCCVARGWDVNIKRTHRIYNELGLQLRNKTPERRVKAKLRDDRKAPTQPNETWAMDFVHDQLATGNKLRTLVDPDRLRIAIAAADPLE